MSITSTGAKELAKLGIDLEISEKSGYTSTSVKEIIKIVIKNDARIKIHAANYTSTSLKEMAKLSPRHVTIEI